MSELTQKARKWLSCYPDSYEPTKTQKSIIKDLCFNLEKYCGYVSALTAELAEAMEEAKVWQDRYRKRGYMMDEHAKALERAEVAEAELARYKSGVEMDGEVRYILLAKSEGTCGKAQIIIPIIPIDDSLLLGNRVRVLVMKEEG